MISVIIPVFNNENTIERAVLSVINDAIVSEILIIDDGSTDNSFEVSQKLSGRNSKVSVFNHPNNENRGASASRNLGLSYAKADWIQFLDADDELLQGKLSSQFELVKPNIAFILGNCIHVLPNGKKHLIRIDSHIWKGLIRSKLGRTSSILWNKKYLLKVNGWNEDLGSSQEYDLMFRIMLCKPKISFVNKYLTLIHKEANSISTNSKKKNKRIQNWLYLRIKMINYLKNKSKFSLLYKYYFYGSVGVFCDENNVFHPYYLNYFYYNFYRFEMILKINVFKVMKFFKL